MKTLIVFELVPEEMRLHIVEGDYQHLQGVYINGSSSDKDKKKELSELLYTEDGDFKSGAYDMGGKEYLSVDWLKSEGVEHIVFCGMFL